MKFNKVYNRGGAPARSTRGRSTRPINTDKSWSMKEIGNGRRRLRKSRVVLGERRHTKNRRREGDRTVNHQCPRQTERRRFHIPAPASNCLCEKAPLTYGLLNGLSVIVVDG
ncbi:hypothetical protein TNIN_260651 [Trichonephila inaurata madagascariensis]|uniref:Uncharacterized protein n=1 Tax=Trichonephila inaurata madagascariensis TaxID=2747483 RepID=A0A8X6YW71_9ARAC|nr:hypothetical protein TNIN_351061 [Trichonephila inaurata madagascariensis]GFY76904.1 hypothetical protein TNIN_260651 [Trichonephila inaurata madagascariensis]